MRVGIVGHASDKFTPETEVKAKLLIRDILTSEPRGTLVSGRCPLSICENCGKKSFSKIDDPIAGYVTCEFCGQEKKRRAGGVDIWAEATAKSLGMETDIKAPRQNVWGAEYGFKQRNIDIAESSDQLHIIVAAEYPPGYSGRQFDCCYHCARIGRNPRDHVKSGACYTGARALRMGKKAEWHIIQ